MSSKKKFKKLRRLAELTERLPLPSSAPVRLLEPLDLVQAFVEAWEDEDADALAALFAEDADFVNVVGLWWTSRTSIRKAHQYGFDRIYDKAKLAIEKVAERRLGEDVAVVHARWRMTGQLSPSGEDADPRRGVISATLIRLEDGSWLAVSFQNTDIAAAADTLLSQDGRLTPASYLGGPSAAEVAAAELVDDEG